MLDRPILVAFSGGGDSIALAFSLLSLQIPTHLAHFDHGWREESIGEADDLEAWANEMDIPFTRGRGSAKTEDGARKERFDFLKKVFERGEFAAIVLGHHADDRSETTLKRVFEGASLRALKGMSAIDEREGVPIWRPLLSTRKSEIFSFLERKSYFEDPTNHDGSNLRSRMRISLIPQIVEGFGKEIHSGLIRLSDRMGELHRYMERRLSSVRPIEGPFGVCWDLSERGPLDPFEMGWLVRLALGHPSESVVERLSCALAEGEANIWGGEDVIVDRHRLFVLKKNVDPTWKLGGEGIPGWEGVWQGKAQARVREEGPFELGPPTKKMLKKWSDAKTPAFLRKWTPVLYQNGRVVGDFLLSDRFGDIPGEYSCICATLRS